LHDAVRPRGGPRASCPGRGEGWLETNRSVVLAAIEQDARDGSGEFSWQLAATLDLYLDRAGRWQEQLSAQATALGAAQRLGDIRMSFLYQETSSGTTPSALHVVDFALPG
ncbi:hypothetical protein ABZ372_49915, partial [Streptomyces sp. NPDC005921]